MTQTICKYQIEVACDLTLSLPRGAEFLTLQAQHEAGRIWFLVDPAAPLEPHQFHFFPTGFPIKQPESLMYLGSIPGISGLFANHLFEER